jgi:arylsulfatase A-like enzyme
VARRSALVERLYYQFRRLITIPASRSFSIGATHPRVGLAIWFALITSASELAILAARRLVFGQELHLSRDVLWMIPLANAAMFAVAYVVIRSIPRVSPTLRDRLGVSTFSFLLLMAVVLASPWILPWTVALPAAVVALIVGRLSDRYHGFTALTGRSTPWLVAALVVANVVVAASRALAARGDAAVPAPAAPNVMLVVLDTVRASSMSLYGSTRPTTPALDALRRRGVLFAHAWAPAPWTLPTHASMFTGLDPSEHGADWTVPLSDRHPVLAEQFRARGYATGGFAANTIYCDYEHGLTRGFQHYVDYAPTVGETLYSSALLRAASNSSVLRNWFGFRELLGRQTAADVNARFLQWQRRIAGRPFFAFINYFDAHAPVLPPPPYDTMFAARGRPYLNTLRYWNHQAGFLDQSELTVEDEQRELAAYEGAIAYIDHQLGRLIDELERAGLLRNTVLIVTADHGDMFGEHGVHSHGNSLYRQVLEVPLLIVAPERAPAGMVVTTPVTLVDIAATALGLAGIDAAAMPGSSLQLFWTKPDWRGSLAIRSSVTWDGVSDDRRAKLEGAGGMRSVVADGMHYIRNADGTEELFRLTDADERFDLASDASLAPVMAKLRAHLNDPTAQSRDEHPASARTAPDPAAPPAPALQPRPAAAPPRQ